MMLKEAGSSLLQKKKMSSVTRDEIERYWRMKKMIEEDHLLAAQKAAARIRANSLKEEDYRRFEESLKAMIEEDDPEGDKKKAHQLQRYAMDGQKELIIGIKDWWTKSRYAYLNQPAVKSMAMGPEFAAKASKLRKCPENNKYIPQLAMLCRFYPSTSSACQLTMHTSTSSSSSTSLGIFF